MKISIALFAILSAAPTVVQAASMKTCTDQAQCLDFTIKEVTGNKCSPGSCEFVVCMTVNLNRSGCIKTGSISHTCEKASGTCIVNHSGFGAAIETPGITSGYTSCQTVHAGDKAEFLMKDGSGVCATGNSGVATCLALEDVYPSGGSCTGNVGTECIWTVLAPACTFATTPVTTSSTDSDNRDGSLSTAEEEAYLCV